MIDNSCFMQLEINDCFSFSFIELGENRIANITMIIRSSPTSVFQPLPVMSKKVIPPRTSPAVLHGLEVHFFLSSLLTSELGQGGSSFEVVQRIFFFLNAHPMCYTQMLGVIFVLPLGLGRNFPIDETVKDFSIIFTFLCRWGAVCLLESFGHIFLLLQEP